MGKTNYQRGFKDTTGPRAVFERAKNFQQITDGGEAIVAGTVACTDKCCGKRGARRDRAGAKKFVNSRTRFHNKQHLDKRIRDGEFDDE